MIWALAMADFQQFIIHIYKHGLNSDGLQQTVIGKTIEDNKHGNESPKTTIFRTIISISGTYDGALDWLHVYSACNIAQSQRRLSRTH